MSGFKRICDIDIDIEGAEQALATCDFGQDDWRKKMPFSPHRNSDSIFLRAPKTIRPRDIVHSMDIDERPLAGHPIWKNLITQVAKATSRPIGRVAILRLNAGGCVVPHVDVGGYGESTERYHIPITTNPKAWMNVEGETFHLSTGAIYWFDKHKVHSAGNDGITDRVHFVVDTVGRLP